ncbi:MAG: alkaline phosphatase family protein [Alphaproteobacteria bacterium]|nr:alkaline phosphatase family protein [Alphaproteobacteria bacterium]
MAFALLTLLLGCPRAVDAPDPEDFPTVILISSDGMRWDYPDRTDTPTLDRLAAEGVRADALIPSFPSKTFPNHYTLATGLYPEHHGIVENTMYDPGSGRWYTITDSAAVSDPWWYGGEPIWVTAENAGLPAGTVFWVGSEADIGGVRPSYWMPYRGSMTFGQRVTQALEWLDAPVSRRPRLLTLYFDEPDHAGHSHGPDGAEVEDAAAQVDVALGALVDGLEERGLLDAVDLFVVSDHGMAALSPDRVVYLDDYIDLREVDVINWSPAATMWVDEARIPGLVEQLSAAEHMLCAAKEDLPEHLHYAAHHRIPPLVCVADPGWAISTRGYPSDFTGGTHGWDPLSTDMQGIFYARGPHVREGLRVEPFENVDVYNLLAAILDLTPAPNDGDPARVDALLQELP